MDKNDTVRYAIKFYNQLTDIIFQWEIYKELNANSITDGFNNEVWEMLQQLPSASSEKEVAQIIFETLSKTYEVKDLKLEDCQEMSKEIYQWWSQQG